MMGKRLRFGGLAAAAMFFWLVAGTAQTQQDKKQDIPDAPSTVQPPPPAPKAEPAPAQENPENAAPAEKPAPAPPTRENLDPTAPIPGTEAAGAGQVSVPENGTNTREELFKIVSRVNFVQVPVTVKDENDRLVNGLLPKDFAVYENGEKQKMTYFTSDPFPLSAAVVFDLGMPDSAVQQVNKTFSALEGAFSQFDEVSLYTYSSTVTKLTDFSAVNRELSDVLNELKTKRGRNDGVPITSGPIAPHPPIINGVPVGQPVPIQVNAPRESHVINDAILAAAIDLSKRDRSRRKIIFVISNGREMGSRASYSDVSKVLLTNGIMVYGIGVGGSGIPGYGALQKLHVPRQGTGDILPKYASATGGELFTNFSKEDIGQVYATAIGAARNQYTLGYLSQAAPGGGLREIEVRVARPDCSEYAAPCIRTHAKAGYYPAPPQPR